MNVRTYQIQWEARERKYTLRYSKLFYALLNRLWRRSAKEYLERGSFNIQDSDFEPLYKRLYVNVGGQEAKIALESMPEIEEKQRKDIFDALANMFSFSGQTATVTFVRELIEQYYSVYVMERLRQVSDYTREMIRLTIQQGINQGLPSRDIAKLITERAPEVNRQRAIRIARTETVSAANKAQLLSHEASPILYKKAWLPVVDNRTRPAHIAMNPRLFIDLWEDFTVGGERMLAPGDTRGSAANCVNCRCVMLFQAQRDANGRIIRKNSVTK